jgi:hypothetical protein
MRSGWAYFVAFQQAKDFAQLSKTKLTMPVLVIGGEKANGTLLGQTDEDRGDQRHDDCPEKYRALGSRGESKRDHRCPHKVFVRS